MAASNTEPQNKIWKPSGWNDGKPVTKIEQPDSTVAEAVIALPYEYFQNAGAYSRATDLSVAYTSAGYAASLVAKASSGTLFGVWGYNSKGSAQFIQIHPAAALPADNAVPFFTATVPTAANFAFTFGDRGLSIANGIVVCNSSTGPSKTIGSADCWFVVAYL